MIKGKSYLIQVPDGKEVTAEFLGTENNYYILKFDSSHCRNQKKIHRMRFESGIACMEGTDHLILREIK